MNQNKCRQVPNIAYAGMRIIRTLTSGNSLITFHEAKSLLTVSANKLENQKKNRFTNYRFTVSTLIKEKIIHFEIAHFSSGFKLRKL